MARASLEDAKNEGSINIYTKSQIYYLVSLDSSNQLKLLEQLDKMRTNNVSVIQDNQFLEEDQVCEDPHDFDENMKLVGYGK